MKKAYLTIDDSPSTGFEEKLSFLLDKKIPAIWFCNGCKLKERSVVNAIKTNHIIGNHGFSHKHFSEMTYDEAVKEILDTDGLIEAAYKEVCVKRPIKLFRFPYGDTGGDLLTERLQVFLEKEGFVSGNFEHITYDWWFERVDVFWTFACNDWIFKSGPNEDFKDLNDILRFIEEPNHELGGSLVRGDSNEIICLHDHDANTEQFFKIIEKIISVGVEFISP